MWLERGKKRERETGVHDPEDYFSWKILGLMFIDIKREFWSDSRRRLVDSYQLSDCKITISINWKLTHATVFLQIEFKLDSQRRKNAKDFTLVSQRLVLIIPAVL